MFGRRESEGKRKRSVNFFFYSGKVEDIPAKDRKEARVIYN